MVSSKPRFRPFSWLASAAVLISLGASSVLFGLCGPFTDVAADAFCPFVQEVFYLGITTGTTATTYDPSSNVTRQQMAAFLSRTVDGVLKRGGNRRGVAEKFWTPQNDTVLPRTFLGIQPRFLKFDGADLWVTCSGSPSYRVSRVRASDGRSVESWTGAADAWGVLLAMGRVIVTAAQSPGKLYSIDPTQPAGAVTTVATNLGNLPAGLAFDGAHVWTANGGGSVSILTPTAAPPWTVTTVSTGFQYLVGTIFDGANVWVTDFNAGTLLKLGAGGGILQTVTVGVQPEHPVFDGTNVWVPNFGGDSVTVVRASNGTVLRTLTGNGISSPIAVAFDGERVAITNYNFGTVSLFKAADLTDLGVFSVGAAANPFGAVSDGVNFWIALSATGEVARF